MAEQNLVTLTAAIVSSYVANNRVAVQQLPELILATYSALSDVVSGRADAAAQAPKLVPAVSVKKSITPDYLISLEDGRQYKSLKRHLRAAYDMSPEEYRAKWGLPRDYPMVAPAYRASRSALAKSIGLGRGGAQRPAEPRGGGGKKKT